MTRLLSVVLIGFLVAASFVMPRPAEPGFESDMGIADPRFSVCLVEEGAGRTTELTVVSLDEGSVQATLFASGRVAGSMGLSLEENGSAVVPVVDITAVGTLVGMVELPTPRGAVASLTRGVEAMSAESCVSATPVESYLSGGNTVGGNEFNVLLMNPFAADAVARMAVATEVGNESNTRFESITVLAHSFVVVEMRQLIPGREEISVLVESMVGRVVVFGRQSGSRQGASWSGVEPSTDWYLPLPPADSPREVLVGNPTGSNIDYQVDLYRTGGMELAAVTGQIPAQSQISLDLEVLAGDAGPVLGVRVIANTPVVATIRSEGIEALALTAGAMAPAGIWLVPGSIALIPPPVPDEGEEPVPVMPAGRLIILNPSIEDALVVIRALGGATTAEEVVVEAESVHYYEFDSADGHIVESDIPVVVLWIAGDSDAMSIGVPIPNG